MLVVLLGALFNFIKWLVRFYRARQLRADSFPFDVIRPYGDVLPAILGDDDSPLADRNIKYQSRIPGRNIRRELEELLEKRGWVLILGRTGLGKTREAAHLTDSLNKEGWTVLNLTRKGWLDAPATLPEQLSTDRKLLFFLDDLNRKMYASRVEQSPKADEPLQRITIPLQERLHHTLKTYEQLVGTGGIRVIATARNEREREFPGEPSEWEKLEFEKYPRLWGHFEIYELPEPVDEAIVDVLAATVRSADIQADPADYVQLAQRNDGTFANVVENLRRTKNRHQALTLVSFQDTLRGTWEQRFQDATSKYPAARYVYDAVDLLRAMNVELKPFTVEPVARLIAGGNLFQRVRHWWQIRTR